MSLDTAEPIVFISRHAIKEGRLEAFQEAYAKGAEAIEREKPDTVAFLAYLDEDRREVNTIHMFPDAAAMDRHFEGVEERAEAHDAHDKFGEYLLEYLNHAYAFIVGGEVVGTAGGFDPEQAVTPDDVADRPTSPGPGARPRLRTGSWIESDWISRGSSTART